MIGICDWCGTEQEIELAFDQRRDLCIDQAACLNRVPVSKKNHSIKASTKEYESSVHKLYAEVDKSLKKVKKELLHGSRKMYKAGCTCSKCSWANARYVLICRKRRSIKVMDLPTEKQVSEILHQLYYGNEINYDPESEGLTIDLTQVTGESASGEPLTSLGLKTLLDLTDSDLSDSQVTYKGLFE